MALETALNRFVDNPVRLSAQQVHAVLDELCVNFGICLTPQDYETVEADPPPEPRALAELIMKLEGLGSDDPEIFVPVLRRVLSTFEGAAPCARTNLGNDAPVIADAIREPEIWARMCATFPWVADERGDIGAGLVHLDFAALRRGLERAVDSTDIPSIREILAFIEGLLVDAKPLHPDVVNAIEISFFEDLYLGDRLPREVVVPFLGPRSKMHWDEIAVAHRTAG